MLLTYAYKYNIVVNIVILINIIKNIIYCKLLLYITII